MNKFLPVLVSLVAFTAPVTAETETYELLKMDETTLWVSGTTGISPINKSAGAATITFTEAGTYTSDNRYYGIVNHALTLNLTKKVSVNWSAKITFNKLSGEAALYTSNELLDTDRLVYVMETVTSGTDGVIIYSEENKYNVASALTFSQGDTVTISSSLFWDEKGAEGAGFYGKFATSTGFTSSAYYLTDNENINALTGGFLFGAELAETPSASNPFSVTISQLVVQTSTTPEPATATLSLLALAGLAARRRLR